MSATPAWAPAVCPDGTTAMCVFAVRGNPDPTGLVGVRGHSGGSPLRLLELPGSLWAVVQSVPAEDFTEEALRQRLSDPAALEACARAHHAVVTAAAADGPVVPLPLATLFTDPNRAVATLDEQRTHFLAVLDRVAGRSEWAVKVHVRQVGDDSGRCGTDPDRAAPGGGLAYLNRVRARERDRHARQEAVGRAAQHVYDTSAAFAVAAVRRRPHGADITGRDRTQVLNAAFLVESTRAADLVTAIRAMDDTFEGLDVETEVSGPWVPYSFTGEDDS
ncbi:GvpL/GvpF family gas vesicle protein [Streptomyces sp. NBC_00448]|uniref:GvpL/GvpF family gas vesicle protein n=1 Tax=Streptomyces sp. NBC_00448 TaxID=2903652 RepID=UPI002E1B11A1